MTFSTNQVAEAAQVTLRQLQWWDEHRVVSSGVIGHQRHWDRDALFKVLIVAKLRAKGCSLQRIRAVLKSLPLEKLQAQEDAVLLIRRKGMRICGDEVALRAADEENGPVWIVALAPIMQKLTDELLKPEPKRKRRRAQ